MIPDLSAVDLAYAEAGQSRWSADWVARKATPFSILSQVVHGQYEIEYAGRRETIRRGELFYSPANTPLRIGHRIDPSRGVMAARWAHITFTVCGGLDLFSLYETPQRIGGAAAKRIGQIIETLLVPRPTEALTMINWSAARAAACWPLVEIVTSLSRPRPEAAELLRRTERLVPLLEHLRQHLAEPITVTDMARRVHMSDSAFYAYFKQHLGQTPQAHLKHLRLNYAGYQLAQTDLPLADIAQAVGFANPFHLSREFRRQFGVTPSQYRKTHRTP